MKAANKDFLLLFVVGLFSLFTLKISVAGAAICGDLFCEAGESTTSCPIDCGVCGDLECDSFESAASCPLDCLGFCGDLICEPGEEETCPQECAVGGTPICGDDVCSPGEAGSCALDCMGDPALCFDDASCDDGNPCTTDSCNNLSGCTHVTLPDTDGDGTCNDLDNDDDNDGIADAQDKDPLNPKICGDSDKDTCDDCAVGVDGFGPASDSNPAKDGPDNDNDGSCDAGDQDDDNDGLKDTQEIITDPRDPDTDDDTICDGPLAVATVCTKGSDNCPILRNPRQSDVDADGIGDACDPRPIKDVSGLCPCDSCPADLKDVEIPGVPGFPNSVSEKATCSTERDWRNHGEYVSCVTHVTNFLGKYVRLDKDRIQEDAARNRCGRGRHPFGGYYRNDGHYWYDGPDGYNGHDRFGGHDGSGGHTLCRVN